MDLHAQQPLFLAVGSALVCNDRHDGFDGRLRQIDTNEQQSPAAGEFSLGKARADQRQEHPETADGFAVSARGW